MSEQDNQGGAEGERTYAGFKTVEELEAAYATLSANGAPAADPTKLTVTPDKGENAEGSEEGEKSKAEGDAEVKDALTAAGLKQDDFTREFTETGTLSDESKDKLEKAGFPRAMVETYLSGLRANQTAYEAQVFEPVGSREAYKELIGWAGKNLDDAEIDAFNEAINSGNAAKAKLAVAGLAQRRGSPARPGSLLTGKTGGQDAVKPYASQAEVRSAINDPRYRSDPAYRKQHEARLMASSF
jgi:hypothetical protein